MILSPEFSYSSSINIGIMQKVIYSPDTYFIGNKITEN